MAKKAAKKKTGRPLAKVDEKMVETLAAVGCSGEEIAIQVGVAKATLYRRFKTLIERGHNTQNTSLRRKQMQAAMGGNITMLIWLGKQHLGQSDKQEVKTEGRQEITIKPEAMTDAQLASIAGRGGNGVAPKANGSNGNAGIHRIHKA